MTKKPVVYTVIDGMSVAAFEQVVASGDAPALAFLKEHSSYNRASIAIFPTITPAATASLVTGETPARHGIPGMCWYDREADRFVNYGQSPRAAVVEGASQIVEDALYNLNTRHLHRDVRTLHESLDEMGLVTASVNYMIFRGPYEHKLQPNFLEKILLGDSLPETLPGPKEHYFADVIEGPAEACDEQLPKRGFNKRIRATDGFAACVTRGLIEKKAADMILFYLHENDHDSHRSGPDGQTESLARADEHIAYVLDAYPSWEEAVGSLHFVVTADHSQSPISDDDDHIVDLAEVLDGFSQVRPQRGDEHFGDNDVAVAGNGRVAFVYLNEAKRDRLCEPVAEALLSSPAIDQVMWKKDDRYVVDSAHGRVQFWREDRGVEDERGNRWGFEGELGAVSGVVDGNRITTPEYPLALWRISEAVDLDRTGDLIATMKLTYECCDIGGGHHKGGGDHASLHVQDSIVPFMSTLSDPPASPSTVDVAPHILRYFSQ